MKFLTKTAGPALAATLSFMPAAQGQDLMTKMLAEGLNSSATGKLALSMDIGRFAADKTMPMITFEFRGDIKNPQFRAKVCRFLFDAAKRNTRNEIENQAKSIVMDAVQSDMQLKPAECKPGTSI